MTDHELDMIRSVNSTYTTAAVQEIERLRAALRLIAWDVEGQEPDLGECMHIASETLNK